jgi:hypothetical protein
LALVKKVSFKKIVLGLCQHFDFHAIRSLNSFLASFQS